MKYKFFGNVSENSVLGKNPNFSEFFLGMVRYIYWMNFLTN